MRCFTSAGILMIVLVVLGAILKKFGTSAGIPVMVLVPGAILQLMAPPAGTVVFHTALIQV